MKRARYEDPDINPKEDQSLKEDQPTSPKQQKTTSFVDFFLQKDCSDWIFRFFDFKSLFRIVAVHRNLKSLLERMLRMLRDYIPCRDFVPILHLLKETNVEHKLNFSNDLMTTNAFEYMIHFIPAKSFQFCFDRKWTQKEKEVIGTSFDFLSKKMTSLDVSGNVVNLGELVRLRVFFALACLRMKFFCPSYTDNCDNCSTLHLPIINSFFQFDIRFLNLVHLHLNVTQSLSGDIIKKKFLPPTLKCLCLHRCKECTQPLDGYNQWVPEGITTFRGITLTLPLSIERYHCTGKLADLSVAYNLRILHIDVQKTYSRNAGRFFNIMDDHIYPNLEELSCRDYTFFAEPSKSFPNLRLLHLIDACCSGFERPVFIQNFTKLETVCIIVANVLVDPVYHLRHLPNLYSLRCWSYSGLQPTYPKFTFVFREVNKCQLIVEETLFDHIHFRGVGDVGEYFDVETFAIFNEKKRLTLFRSKLCSVF